MDYDYIKKDIEILRKIKILDDELVDIETEKETFLQDRSLENSKIESFNTFLEESEKNLVIYKNNISQAEANISQFNEKIDQITKEKNKNGSNDSVLKKLNEDIEIFELKIEIEKKDIEKNKNLISNLEKEIQRVSEEKKTFLSTNYCIDEKEINSKILDINNNKQILFNQLSVAVQKIYERNIYDNNKKILTNIVDGFCDNCYLKTTPQQVIDVLEGKKFVQCEYCGCIFLDVIKK